MELNVIDTFILLSLALCYIGLLVFFFIGWMHIPYFSARTKSPRTKVSVLIAARNEEAMIHLTIQDLLNQDYPKEFMEIIIVDDHSIDRTAEIVASYPGVRLLRLNEQKPMNSYKKKAITEAINIASGELMVATDADCRMGKNWLSTIVGFYEQHHFHLISSPVAYFEEKSWFEMVQTLEFFYLIGLGAAAIGNRMPATCNGANLAYTKEIFTKLGGFSGIDNLASGDDELFMHKVALAYPGSVGFCKSHAAIVYTHAKPSLKEFLLQRKRWASKSTHYKKKSIIVLSVLIWLFNASLLINMFFCFFNPFYFYLVAFVFAMKISIELFFLWPIAKFMRRVNLLPYLGLLSVIHVVYFVYIGIAGNSGKYTWKGRWVQ